MLQKHLNIDFAVMMRMFLFYCLGQPTHIILGIFKYTI